MRQGGEGPHLALAIEATALGARVGVRTGSVVYRGDALPVAWPPERFSRGMAIIQPKAYLAMVNASGACFSRFTSNLFNAFT